MKINGTDITMIRGDSECIYVTVVDTSGEPVPLREGDTIYFTVKTSTQTEKKIIQKVVTVFEDGGAIIEIEPDDTRGVGAGTYFYDIQLTRENGEVKTIIHPSRFTLKGDVTHEQ